VARFLRVGDGPAVGRLLELDALHRDGHELPIEMTLSADADGETWRFSAFVRDVSERRRMTEALHRERAALVRAQAIGGVGSWELDPATGTTEWSAHLYELLGRDPAQGPGPLSELAGDPAAPDGPPDPTPAERRVRHGDGGWRRVVVEIGAADPDTGRIAGTVRDVTHEREAQDALREAEARFRSAFDHAPIGMAVIGPDGRFGQVNDAFCDLVGRARRELLGQTLAAITHPDDVQRDRVQIAAMLTGATPTRQLETRFVHANGHPVRTQINASLVRAADSEPDFLLVQVQDVTERRRYEERLQHMADHDPLTGLLNRRSFERELERHVANVARYGVKGAALVIDLDHFKYYNDTLGHGPGDELIVRIAQALRSRLRETDVIARLGGDEFAVILPREDADSAMRVAEDLLARVRRETIRQPDGHRRRGVTASIGVAPFEDSEGQTGEDVLVNADLAMYEAKQDGRDRVSRYRSTELRDSRAMGRVHWVDEIQHALDHGGLTLKAQPIVDLRDRSVLRHELLLRMRTRTDDLAAPASFLYIAEQVGLAAEIDRWVVGTAITALDEQVRCGRELHLEVNLSAHSLAGGALLDLIEGRLAATGVPAHWLTFEISETAAVANISHAREFADHLAGIGCHFALDDFGAGFGSFTYLKHLTFDTLKIDGEFVRACATDPTDRLLIESVVTVAQGLGKRTVAENVEDEATAATLARLGVDLGQGLHLGRPVPVLDVLGARSQMRL
jgi:diguanylate cyclase (GGDEF)-like protein/PAS domain S-box-containing protein